MKKKYVALSLVLLAWAPIGASFARSVPLAVNTPSGLRTQLEHGAIHGVMTYYHHHWNKHPKIGHAMLRLSKLQIKYDIPALLRYALKCERSFGISKSIGDLSTAFYCNEIARYSALSVGDIHAFFSATSFAANKILPALSDLRGEKFIFGGGLDEINAKKLALSTAATRETWKKNSKTLPTRNTTAIAEGQAPAIAIRIDGVDATAWIATSIGFTAPVTIVTPVGAGNAAYAKFQLERLGQSAHEVRTQKGASAGAGRGVLALSNTDQLALAVNVQLGPLVLKNMGVVVAQSDDISPGVYIGMAMLRRFGGVAIERQQVVLSRQPLESCSTPVPMAFASTIAMSGHLVFPVKLNGKTLTAEWASGLAEPLAVDPKSFHAALGAGAEGFTATSQSKHSAITLQVGKAVLHPYTAKTPRTWHFPYQVAIGESTVARAHESVRLRFTGKQPTISLCKASPDKAEH